MFITKKHLDRRTVLRGAGISVALPLLDRLGLEHHRSYLAIVEVAPLLQSGEERAAGRLRPLHLRS